MGKFKSIGAFGGGRSGDESAFIDDSFKMGELIAQSGYNLVYGGGSNGVMGAVARGALKHSGRVKSIISKYLYETKKENYDLDPGKELEFHELLLTDGIRSRKASIFDNSDAIVILPGGFGTFDEAFNTVVEKYLKEHDKPIIFLNSNGYWDIYEMIENHIINNGFAKEEYRHLVKFACTPEEVIEIINRENGS